MAFGQVPSAGSDEERGDLLTELVMAAVGSPVADRPLDGVSEVDLTRDQVGPRRGGRVLKVGHEPVGARVERIDHQLPIGWTRDLDPALLQLGRDGGYPPVGLPDRSGLGQEIEPLAGVESLAPPRAGFEQIPPASAELALELGDELQRSRRQNLLKGALQRSLQLDASHHDNRRSAGASWRRRIQAIRSRPARSTSRPAIRAASSQAERPAPTA